MDTELVATCSCRKSNIQSVYMSSLRGSTGGKLLMYAATSGASLASASSCFMHAYTMRLSVSRLSRMRFNTPRFTPANSARRACSSSGETSPLAPAGASGGKPRPAPAATVPTNGSPSTMATRRLWRLSWTASTARMHFQ